SMRRCMSTPRACPCASLRGLILGLLEELQPAVLASLRLGVREAEVLEQLLVWIRACGLSIEADVHACLDSEVRAVWLLEGCQTTDCLVALASDSQQVVLGCIDIRLPRAATGVHPAGVPAEDHQGAYLLNVVVHMDWRGQGVGKALMRGAMERAHSHWQASNLYTHVAADNEVAWGLYRSCGFEEHSCEAKYSQASALACALIACVEAEAAAVASMGEVCLAARLTMAEV
ncbi:predicted protein, partial [Haematococcus lacustris]